VHLVLKDDAVVDEVIAAALPGLAADAILIDHSTTLPKLTAERAEKLHAQGVKYLHCPVFMGPPAARSAQGSMMVCGPKALFESVSADLARMTGRLVYLGERTDLGAVYKLCGNTLLIGVWATLADVLALATTSGVGAEDAIKMLGLLDLNTVVSTRGTNMAKGNFAPNFELAMARKDVRLMLEALGDQPMAVLPSIAARMDQLITAGHGRDDAGVMAINALGKAAPETPES
jgi:3-hydroxyisobutyrate dehydrogenase-like beta-hydroxyacid dehydrogenase